MLADLTENEARAALENLRERHRTLGEQVAALSGQHIPNQLELMRLKREKLAVKDRIARLEDLIFPDIIA